MRLEGWGGGGGAWFIRIRRVRKRESVYTSRQGVGIGEGVVYQPVYTRERGRVVARESDNRTQDRAETTTPNSAPVLVYDPLPLTPPLLLTHPSERCDALTLVHSAGVRWTAGPDAVPPLAHSCRFGPCRARPRPSAPTFSLGLVGARYMEGLVWRRKEGEGTCARAVKRKKTYKDNNDNVNMSAYLFLNKHSYRYIDR